MIRREEALAYHEGDRPGKIEIHPIKRCLTARDMRLAALPGAGFPCAAIQADPEAVFRYTAKGNLVGIITNGSAVPGLGDVGPSVAKPMLEGAAVLFKRLADLDGFDLELDTRDPDRFVETVQMLEPTFGGINLKDIRAPEGLDIFHRLRDTLHIPVVHENLQSPAVVAAAALLNALDLADKAIADARIVMCGAGTVGLGCAEMFLLMGVSPGNLFLYDVQGLVHPDRADLNPHQRRLARADAPATLEDGMRGADVFVGASAPGVVTQTMIRSMARYPIVFALATPEPEIGYDEARASRRDVIVATALTQFPNAVADHLSYPYIFRGALDVHAVRITDGMLVAAARALAELAREDVVDEVSRAYNYERFSFGPEYLLPKPIDPRILVRESAAVARQAVTDGVARRPLDTAAYQESLAIRLGPGRETLRRLMVKARQVPLRIVFSDGAIDTIQRAAAILVEEGIAQPVLLGEEGEIRAGIARLGLDPSGLTIIDPARSPRREAYVAEYLRMRRRHGVMPPTAEQRLHHTEYFGAMQVHSGDADMLMSGIGQHYADSVRVLLETIGTADGVRRVSSYYLVLLPREVYALADCAVNIDPAAEDLAETALLTARMVRLLGIDPRVAMLSFSNFGGVDHPFARKVRRATELVKEQAPGLAVDGEMQLATAVDAEIRRQFFRFSDLEKDANVLIFPDLQSGNLALHLLQHVGEGVVVGPVLTGTRLPVQLLQYGSTVQDVVNLAAVGVVQAVGLRGITG
jgi:malate dehydrogenase (oxaloacetate-decarboxylating)(NADP+)